MMETQELYDGLEVISFASQAEWEAWLERNHSAAGVWVKFARKGSGIPTATYDEVLEVALCFGWIDGVRKGFDGTWFIQKFTPRRRKSIWSKINRAKVEKLESAGRMRPGGLAAVAAAKADGRWDAAYDSPANATPSPELQAALDASPAAAEQFARLTKTNRFAIMFRVHSAKRPETKQRRIADFVERLERGEKAFP